MIKHTVSVAAMVQCQQTSIQNSTFPLQYNIIQFLGYTTKYTSCDVTAGYTIELVVLLVKGVNNLRCMVHSVGVVAPRLSIRFILLHFNSTSLVATRHFHTINLFILCFTTRYSLCNPHCAVSICFIVLHLHL